MTAVNCRKVLSHENIWTYIHSTSADMYYPLQSRTIIMRSFSLIFVHFNTYFIKHLFSSLNMTWSNEIASLGLCLCVSVYLSLSLCLCLCISPSCSSLLKRLFLSANENLWTCKHDMILSYPSPLVFRFFIIFSAIRFIYWKLRNGSIFFIIKLFEQTPLGLVPLYCIFQWTHVCCQCCFFRIMDVAELTAYGMIVCDCRASFVVFSVKSLTWIHPLQ